MERGFGFAFAFRLRPAGTFDVRAGTVVLPIEKEHARPEIDRLFVAMGEVTVEAREQ